MEWDGELGPGREILRSRERRVSSEKRGKMKEEEKGEDASKPHLSHSLLQFFSQSRHSPLKLLPEPPSSIELLRHRSRQHLVRIRRPSRRRRSFDRRRDDPIFRRVSNGRLLASGTTRNLVRLRRRGTSRRRSKILSILGWKSGRSRFRRER